MGNQQTTKDEMKTGMKRNVKRPWIRKMTKDTLIVEGKKQIYLRVLQEDKQGHLKEVLYPQCDKCGKFDLQQDSALLKDLTPYCNCTMSSGLPVLTYTVDSDEDEEKAYFREGTYVEPHFRQGTHVKGHWRKYGKGNSKKLVWVNSYDRKGGRVQGHWRSSPDKK